VRSVEDDALLVKLRREKIHLEVCPTSNVQTGLCQDYSHHPVDRLFKSGVSLGINTDARTITNITLNEEYCRLHDQFAWGAEEFAACNREALRAAFVEDSVKNRLASQLALAAGAPD
jgi:adenosine deaminase